jgi:hypothetical protein
MKLNQQIAYELRRTLLHGTTPIYAPRKNHPQCQNMLKKFLNYCQQALAQIECSGEQASKPVIHRFLQILFASEVTLRRQN